MRRVWQYRFRQTTLTLAVCLAFLIGVGLARVDSAAWLKAAWPLAVVLLVIGRQRTALSLCLAVLLGLGLGVWRGAIFTQKLAVYQPYYYREVTLSVRAMNDAVYGTKSQISFDADDLMLDDGTRLAGKIQLSGFGENAVFQGDELTATGKLYPGYGAYQGRISFAELHVSVHHPSLVAEIRRRFTAGMQTALPEPLAPFAMGLLIGQRATLPADNKQDLLMVGLTHIIAVSGYNLTIILHASKRLLAKRSKRLSTLLSFSLIAVFLLLAGASASIVRAAIVSTLSITASYYGRDFKPLNLLALAAAITAWANPFYVWSDLSWYLSFLAFFGVMVVSPLVQARWPGRWHQSLVGGVALESVCAELMSLPFILYIFGQMSFVGLPANVLVTALVPLAMLLGTIAGLAGMLIGPVAGWLAWPAALLLNYMLDIAHLMAHLPHIFVQNLSLPLAGMLGLYGLIILLTVVLWHKTKLPRADIITDMNELETRGLKA
ncbi:MAG TPA: ComEC/Rec2 family competence protein [Candidatus Saccharimonadales bacterium]